MILLPEQLVPIARVVSALMVLLIMVWLTRAIWRTSPALGLLAAGVTLVRVVLAVGLLAISAWDLPLLRGVHTGDGFWTLSGDSRVYYELGLTGAYQGLAAVPFGSPSPAYTRLLAIWLWGVGPWMFVPIALNAVAYLVMVLAIARTCLTGRHQVPLSGAVLSVGAISLSPILMFCSTQILKDVVFAVLLVLFVLIVRNWLPRFKALVTEAHVTAGLFISLGLMIVTLLLIAGIRAYYGVFLILGLGVPLTVWVISRPLRYALPRSAAAIIVVCMLWMAFAVGAGGYYAPYGAIIDRVQQRVAEALPSIDPLRSPADDITSEPAFVGALDRARHGFVASGGNTNIAPSSSESSARGHADVDKGMPTAELERDESRLKSTLLGLAVMFLPLSLLEPLGIVDLPLGRGATMVADADTLFVLVTIVLLGGFAWASVDRVSIDWALVGFVATVAVVSIVLIAYVVTNVGTMTRLRVPALIFVWMMPLATRVRPLQIGQS